MTDQVGDGRPARERVSAWARLAHAIEWGWAHLTAWLGALFWLCFWLVVVAGRRLTPLRRRWRAVMRGRARPPADAP